MKPRVSNRVPLPVTAPEWTFLSALKINDSFMVPFGKKRAVYKYAAAHGIVVTVRKQGDQIRVWRIK